jgi:hypothetical protein
MPAGVLLLILLAIVAVWIGSTAAASRYSGWAALAPDFPAAREDLPGERFRSASATMGGEGMAILYGGSLRVVIGEAGIGLSIGFPQRLFSPPLFIPWRAVATVEVHSSAMLSAATIRLHGRDKIIRLRGDAGGCALKTWARFGQPAD